MNDTKERILAAALRLFSTDGYEGVSVSDISGALGMTKGALYRHYKNKRDIFESILTRMEQRDAAHAKSCFLPEGRPEEMPEAYRSARIEQILAFGKSMFRYWTQDAFASLFRKMLALEQYRNEEMGKLFQQYLVSGPIGYLTDLFFAMDMAEPESAAVRFYAPMFLLYSVYDGADDKTKVVGALDHALDSTISIIKQKKER